MSLTSVSSTGATIGSTLNSESRATLKNISLGHGGVVIDPTYAIKRFVTDTEKSQPRYHVDSKTESTSAYTNRMITIIENFEAAYNTE